MKKITVQIILGSLIVFGVGCANNEDTTSEAKTEPKAATAIPDQSNVPPKERLREGPRAAQPEPDGPEVAAVTFGRGVAKGDGLEVNFLHNVTRYQDGTADGEFKHSAITEAGIIDIEAKVTCAELDGKIGKGWMGGTVTRNDSTNPLYLSEKGVDVWFRILDLGATEQTALISMPSFKQDGIKNSTAYCEKKPWSDKGLLKVDSGALAIFP